ncbi:ABC transporter ATP-binding protein [Buchananella felis]|uniref:ABC transporter ATP-binding protein n=1 Tax=Buchananella felis TaxID=3231492 RepID=UPI003528E34A
MSATPVDSPRLALANGGPLPVTAAKAPMMDDAAHATIGVKDLRFSYRKGGEELYDGLSYTFSPGQVTAVTGESGRGKSTLLYVLGLLLTPTSGRVEIDGEPVSHLPDRRRSLLRAQRLGFVFQDSELDPTRTILDSVMEPGLYGGADRASLESRALELLAQFGLSERSHHKPGQTSGGQAQRVAVCRALINSPDFVLADEPTGNLDPRNSTLVLDALAAAASEGRTVIVATHDPFVIERSDQVLAL